MNAVRKFVTNNQNKVSMLLVAAASLAAVGAAHAGSGGTEFAAAYTLIEGWITGVLAVHCFRGGGSGHGAGCVLRPNSHLRHRDRRSVIAVQ
jgi:hypothetical protein